MLRCSFLFFVIPVVFLISFQIYRSATLSLNLSLNADASDARIPKAASNHNENDTDVMPRISFPSISWIQPNDLFLANNGTSLGGCESKFILQHATTRQTFIFKPAHGAHESLKGRYEFRPSKGGLVYLYKSHPPKILNEFVAFVANQILHLDRIPPVVPVALNETFLHGLAMDAVENNKKKKSIWKCQMDFSSTSHWLRTQETSSSLPMIIGTLQLKINNVRAVSQWDMMFWNNRHRNHDVLSERELNTRTLFDYIVGNWDRGYSNNFVYNNTLVYIDQNALRTNVVPFDLFQRLAGSKCRFYRTPIRQLQAKPDLASQIDRVLQPYTEKWKLPSPLGPLVHMNERVQAVLAYANGCVQAHGRSRVFSD